jgi:hypothetical protein
MTRRPACPHCGTPGCTRHGRRRYSRHHQQKYYGDYRKDRATLMAMSPQVCMRCGQGPRYGDPWEAGHVTALGGGTALQREHRSCNRRHGAKLKEVLRRLRKEQRNFLSGMTERAIARDGERSFPHAR